MTKKLFKFEDQNLLEDATNDKGKVTRYKVVFVIKESEELARIGAGLDEGYTLVRSYELPEGWQV
jgi:hypothetical protein